VANRPTFYADPTGLWVGIEHESMTYNGASAAGCSYNGANKLAKETRGVDYRKDSQKPENAYWHAMVDGRPGADPAESIRKYNDLQSEASHTCSVKDLALALHAFQDSHAPAHGFKPWGGHLSEYGKHYTDAFPSAALKNHIIDETRRFLEDARRRCPCLCN
jgi:hypothetical protein